LSFAESTAASVPRRMEAAAISGSPGSWKASSWGAVSTETKTVVVPCGPSIAARSIDGRSSTACVNAGRSASGRPAMKRRTAPAGRPPSWSCQRIRSASEGESVSSARASSRSPSPAKACAPTSMTGVASCLKSSSSMPFSAVSNVPRRSLGREETNFSAASLPSSWASTSSAFAGSASSPRPTWSRIASFGAVRVVERARRLQSSTVSFAEGSSKRSSGTEAAISIRNTGTSSTASAAAFTETRSCCMSFSASAFPQSSGRPRSAAGSWPTASAPPRSKNSILPASANASPPRRSGAAAPRPGTIGAKSSWSTSSGICWFWMKG